MQDFIDGWEFAQKHEAALDRAWAEVLVQIGMRGATPMEDMRKVIDRKMSPDVLAWSLRVRGRDYAHCADDFTIRCAVPGGWPTEKDKIEAGQSPRLMLYAFSTIRQEDKGVASPGLLGWKLVDLHGLRAAFKSRASRGVSVGVVKPVPGGNRMVICPDLSYRHCIVMARGCCSMPKPPRPSLGPVQGALF